MNSINLQSRTNAGVGTLLREWRDRRGISQLELASRAKSSARHISFIETGRARPSLEVLLRLADHLDVPIRDRNSLLIAAGFDPTFPETPLDDPDLAIIRNELRRLLVAYEPNPVLIHDAHYYVVDANRAFAMLVSDIAEHLLHPPVNLIRITLHPEGIAPRILNFTTWRGHLLERVRRHLARSGSADLRALYEEVRGYAYPSPLGERGGGSESGGGHLPHALPLRLVHRGRALSFMSTVMTFNAPTDVTVSELAVETLLPADPETVSALQSLYDHLTPEASDPGNR